MPRPKISNVTLQEVEDTAQTTILVSWSSNTDISSIVTYYPENNPSDTLDQVDVKMITGKHQMIVKGLIPQTNYKLIVKGVDRIGNMAQSNSQRFTTSTDTRDPVVTNLTIQGQIAPSGSNSNRESSAQLVVSWDTDEPATSQVELGVGSGSSYSQKTQQDSNLTYNHTVVISGLVPSTVYHVRAISLDAVGNKGYSVDTVTISPKATDNALNLVIFNLMEIFGFLGR
jgi:chitodextrinase